ncbi:DUF2238 domain-containing protein [archaeon]|nr:DUF2238 domain-containing protein [archaeon]
MENKNKTLFVFMIFIIIAFTIYSYFAKNSEFLYYGIVYILITLIAYYHQKRFKIPVYIITLLIILFILHMLGGSVYLNEIRLYDYMILIFRYDQIIHIFGSFVVTLSAYEIIKDNLSKEIKKNSFNLSLLLILISLGVGAIYEIIEFFAVIILQHQGVGDYINNALDLIFNLFGALIASVIINKKKKL